jgi:MYXO-CTERM domain-containing protein
VWGGPPPELAQAQPAVKPALGLAFVPRGRVELTASLVHDEPDLDVRAGSPKPRTGCGCQTSDPAGLVLALLLVRPFRRRKR